MVTYVVLSESHGNLLCFFCRNLVLTCYVALAESHDNLLEINTYINKFNFANEGIDRDINYKNTNYMS